jgi:hypothetical protein
MINRYNASKENDKYEDRGVAKIQDEMIKLEKFTVKELVRQKKLNKVVLHFINWQMIST